MYPFLLESLSIDSVEDRVNSTGHALTGSPRKNIFLPYAHRLQTPHANSRCSIIRALSKRFPRCLILKNYKLAPGLYDHSTARPCLEPTRIWHGMAHQQSNQAASLPLTSGSKTCKPAYIVTRLGGDCSKTVTLTATLKQFFTVRAIPMIRMLPPRPIIQNLRGFWG